LVVGPAFDQSRVLEPSKVVDDGLGADPQVLADLGDVAGFMREKPEDAPPVLVPEEVQEYRRVHNRR
jgi:hypothetical protein